MIIDANNVVSAIRTMVAAEIHLHRCAYHGGTAEEKEAWLRAWSEADARLRRNIAELAARTANAEPRKRPFMPRELNQNERDEEERLIMESIDAAKEQK